MQHANTDPRLREIMHSFEMAEIDKITSLSLAEKKGERKGKRKEKQETASRMLAKGFDAETVAELTDLSVDEIKKLATV